MDKLLRYCRANGTKRLVGIVLRENRFMIGLGFVIDGKCSDRDALRIVLELG